MSDKLENAIKSLMTAVRRNTEYSKCLDVFEQLLSEVPEKTAMQVIADMNRYFEECMILFCDVDKMKERRFKAKILTNEFIRPESFFWKSRKLIKEFYKINDWKEHTPFTPDKIISGDKEEDRKMVLLWNYVPAITKAILMTKRRAMGLDGNSKRFK